MKTLTEEQILKTVLAASTIEEAASSLGQNNVTSGSKVAVIEDPTYPYSGLVGTVKGVKENGYADVEFANGATVPMMVNQLIVV
jgi:hypothetical protein